MKTTAKVTHTPGPWRFDTDSGTVGQAKLNGVEVIASIEAPPLGTNKWDTDALLANGAIIAAAPDMLEALEAVAQDAGFGTLPIELRRTVNAAIAKAKGAE